MNIKDDSDGVTRYDIPTPVVVQPNEALVASLSDTLLSGDNANAIASLTKGGVQAATSFINSFTSCLDSQSTGVYS